MSVVSSKLELSSKQRGNRVTTMHPDLKGYLQEIARLRRLPEDANVRDAEMTRESGPETPEERLYTIACIFGEEGWHFPTR
jgi:hypothetical protein